MIKNTYRGMVLFFCCALCTGCTSMKTSSYYKEATDPVAFSINLQNISVNIDHVRDETIATQIYAMVLTELHNYNYPDSTAHTADMYISVMQRSYISGVEQRNSVSITCKALLPDGSLVAEENAFLSGNISIISTTTQYRYVINMIRSLCKKQEKLNKGIQKQSRELQ